jgi:hypothetical protein
VSGLKEEEEEELLRQNTNNGLTCDKVVKELR